MMYFITGLPRSRTAWLANFMTYGSSFCYHELLRERGAAGMLEAMTSDRYDHVGNSDCGIPFFAKYLPGTGLKLIVVRRNADEVINSLLQIFPTEQGAIELVVAAGLKHLNRLQIERPCLIVEYDELGEVATCKAIWDYCIPDAPFDTARWALLDKMKVETTVFNTYNKTNTEEVLGCLG
jgi:hypothetical protein